MKDIRIKPYKKEADYSYSLGLFPTIELFKYQSSRIQLVIFSQSAEKSAEAQKLKRSCMDLGIPVVVNDKQLNILSKSGNSLVAGVFAKYDTQLSVERPHIVLVEPDDMGNIGTILRSMLGFGYRDLAIIGQAADYWHPKSIRASMGALFQQRVAHFATIEAYRSEYPEHALYPFMLSGAQSLEGTAFSSPHSLMFGNEGSGLPPTYKEIGQPVFIKQESEIDSLNLATAVSVAMYHTYTRT